MELLTGGEECGEWVEASVEGCGVEVEVGMGNYTEERKTLLKDFSVNDIARNIQEKK